jgi:hypothetical protein
MVYFLKVVSQHLRGGPAGLAGGSAEMRTEYSSDRVCGGLCSE